MEVTSLTKHWGFEHLKLNDVVVPGVLMDIRET